MLLRFDIRPDQDGWTIYDRTTDQPAVIDELVSEGYLRQIPVDPMTGSNQSWKIIMEDTPAGGDNQPPGIFDVKSGAEGNSLDGSPYSDW